MKNVLKLELVGYTVTGKDRRDGSTFEDFIVMSNLDGARIDQKRKLIELYAAQGYEVLNSGITQEEFNINRTTHDSITVELDLIKTYVGKKKALKQWGLEL